MRHCPDAQRRGRLARDDRAIDALRVSRKQQQHFDRWPRPQSLFHRVPLLAADGPRLGALDPGVVIEGERGELATALRRDGGDIVVEARHVDATRRVVQAAQHLCEGKGGVDGDARRDTAVHVALRAHDRERRRDDSAHRRHGRWRVVAPLHRVGEDDHVTGEPLGVLLQQRSKVRRPDLLLALDQQLHVHRMPLVRGGGRMRAVPRGGRATCPLASDAPRP